MTKEEIKQQIKSVSSGPSGITFTWATGCTLTAEQKADIEASSMMDKWAIQIPAYLDECSTLRAENPTFGDTTIRTLARAGFKIGS